MAEYKVTKVSEQPPREYDSPNGSGKVYYIKVMLEGHNKPVSVGKKSPDAIKVGDVLTGAIEATTYSEDKFKAEKPFSGGFKGQPKDEAGIKAMWAIGQAVQAYGPNKGGTYDDYFADLETYATKLFAMVDRVKASDGTQAKADSF